MDLQLCMIWVAEYNKIQPLWFQHNPYGQLTQCVSGLTMVKLINKTPSLITEVTDRACNKEDYKYAESAAVAVHTETDIS